MQDISVSYTRSFQKAAAKLLSDSEFESLIEFVANFPESGAIIQGSGGLRKLRWAYGNTGKSGGARVIYYYFKNEFEAYLIDLYGKSKKESLSKAELKILVKLVEGIKHDRR
ncbi:MAG: RelE-like Cytotoxic translational repressor of toxin-antitoxin stability system [Hyphomonadaceae bacterium]|nr:MAG: RelE-like Cytotoxic translational repressor of toxin-antitoxin stability system [Hyphomonadaceae bacterium]KAF0186042.1 MAG: RelE-like Cytotoxic translational repressor of toxin-antitoxin stability system [Hyphomonadaceae bacterium]